MKLITRAAVVRLSVLFAALTLAGTWAWYDMIRMPQQSFVGPLPLPSDEERRIGARLRADVEHLAQSPRNLTEPRRLQSVASWIDRELSETGLTVGRHQYDAEGHVLSNVVATLEGTNAGTVIIGAHYDTAEGSPGANDNASGVAVMLALARALSHDRPSKTVRFVAFANEEPPFFKNDGMGSLAYARSCREKGDRIFAMLSLETVGYYSAAPDSQKYPPPLGWFYPSTGNFIAFVGSRSSRWLFRTAVSSFRRATKFPSEGAALPSFVQGVDWSDHGSFWQNGYPAAIMVTDTAPFRYPHYHRRSDTPDQLDYDRMSRVAAGLVAVVRDLAMPRPPPSTAAEHAAGDTP